jgi:beta-lactamase class A
MVALLAGVGAWAVADDVAPAREIAGGQGEAACWTRRVTAAREIAAARPGLVAFALVDPRGREWGWNRGRPSRSASLLKTTLMVAYLRRPGVRDRALSAPERALLAPMIRVSDNTATGMLLRRLPPDALTGTARATGQRSFRLESPVWGLSRTSAIDQARLMHRVEGALPPRHRRYALGLLATISPSQRWGLPQVVPAGTRIAFKGGWGSGTGRVTSQAARLVTGGRVWSVAVLTERNPGHAAGVATIRRVGRALIGRGPCAS